VVPFYDVIFFRTRQFNCRPTHARLLRVTSLHTELATVRPCISRGESNVPATAPQKAKYVDLLRAASRRHYLYDTQLVTTARCYA